MTTDFKIVEEPKKPISMHPKKFAMWIFLATVVMVFASLTSAYIVRRAEGNWVLFDLPDIFYYTTVIIILSSITMQWAFFAAKKDNITQVKLMICITLILGLLFLVGQYIGWWIEMPKQGIHFVGNPSGSFVIVLILVHGAHLLGAITFLIIVLASAIKLQVHSKKMAQIEMCATFWHFLGGLWLYLFVFLILNR